MHILESITRGNKTVEIFHDEWPTNPREEYDHVGTMWCWHRRYYLGSKAEQKGKPDSDRFSGWEELENEVVKDQKPVVILPVYMLDHSGIALSTGSFADQWDSGRVGFIFATREQVLKAYAVKRITKKIREKVEACLRAEVEEYSAYANGECYGWRLLKNGEEVDSCSGYYGWDSVTESAPKLEEEKKHGDNSQG